eukprot:Em0014g68a
MNDFSDNVRDAMLKINAATSDADLMSEDIVAVLQRSGVMDVLNVANKNALTNHLAFWEALMIRQTAIDQLKDGLRHHKLLTAVQHYPESFESFFTFKGYITADEVLSCIDSSGFNPPLRAMLNTYISTASHRATSVP